MIISRNTIAILLETRPSNIESLKQVDNDIYIKLGDCEHELSMTVHEYQNCLDQLRSNKGHIDSANFVTIAIIIGTFVGMTISAVNLNLANYEQPTSAELMSDNY